MWTPADGSPPIDLTDEGAGYSVEAEGTRGLRSVTYAFTATSYAGIDGEEVQAIRAEANRPSLGMLVRAGSESEFRARCRRLVHDMRPKAGEGTLTVTTEDGESRRLRCYVESGLEGDQADDTEMPGRWWKFVVKLYAPKPWWLGDPVPVDFGLAAPTNFFPMAAVVLSPSTIQGETTLDLSDSDAPSYPIWTVTGPGDALVLTNTTTGHRIEVDAAIGDGQTVIIDTRPGHQSVRSGTGANLMGSLASDPALWPLVEGVNEVSALLTNATGNSRIAAVYEPRYAGI